MALGAVLVNRFVESQLWGNSFGEQLWGTALGSSAGKGFGEQLWEAALRKLFPKAACFPKLLSKAPSQTSKQLCVNAAAKLQNWPRSCSPKLLFKVAGESRAPKEAAQNSTAPRATSKLVRLYLLGAAFNNNFREQLWGVTLPNLPEQF